MSAVDTLIAGRNQIGKELATLDFANLIGGPLNAVVEAQAKAALTTVNFIKEVAFDQEGKARQVNFTYTRSDTDGKTREYNLSVPFLTMLPIPYIAVKKATIGFNAKITSTVSADTSDSLKTDVNADISTGFWFMRAKIQSKVSYQKTNSSAAKEERTYDLHINVEACNEEMPAGTERLLTILEQSIGESKGPELIIVKVTVGKNNNEVTMTEIPPGAEVKQGMAFMALGTVTGKEPQQMKFTVSAAPQANKFTATPETAEAKLAESVTSITFKLPKAIQQ